MPMPSFLSRFWASPRQAPLICSHPRLNLVLDDLTEQRLDAIVNAADWSMLGGSGVDGAIHAKAGPKLGAHIALRKLRLEVGLVVTTPGFALPCKHILHTCAPVYVSPPDDDLRAALRLCYVNCIRQADRMGLASVCFPLLGAGAFGWPALTAAVCCAEAVSAEASFCESLREIRICAFGESSLAALEMALGITGSRVRDSSTLVHHAGASALTGLTPGQILGIPSFDERPAS